MAYATPIPRNVALLYGGTSSEREVSLVSGEGVRSVLKASGHKVTMVDTGLPGFLNMIAASNAEVAFIALHGTGGEDGTIQGALELLRLPYTGSGVLASALAMDKQRSKALYRSADLRTPEAIVLERHNGVEQAERKVLESIGLPCVIKPVREGSSVGISIVHDAQRLTKALTDCFAVCTTALAETLVAGTEITVSVIGRSNPVALPIIEIIVNSGEFYDYQSKYAAGGSTHIIPARISAAAAAAAQQAALAAHQVLGCSGVSRTDMFVDEADQVWLIETNTIPGMTPTSLLPEAARAAGIAVPELYDRLLDWALEASTEAATGVPENVTVEAPAS